LDCLYYTIYDAHAKIPPKTSFVLPSLCTAKTPLLISLHLPQLQCQHTATAHQITTPLPYLLQASSKQTKQTPAAATATATEMIDTLGNWKQQSNKIYNKVKSIHSFIFLPRNHYQNKNQHHETET
jgi:hypothetical protein